MVKYHSSLDSTFAALSHPTRRAILTRLERVDGCTVSELSQFLVIKLPALMKHLDVLANASLIRRFKESRTVTVRLSSMPLREAKNWLHRYQRFWTPRLDRLQAYAEANEKR